MSVLLFLLFVCFVVIGVFCGFVFCCCFFFFHYSIPCSPKLA